MQFMNGLKEIRSFLVNCSEPNRGMSKKVNSSAFLFSDDNDSWLHFTSSSWIQSILDKNLPGDETVEELNKV